MAEIDHELNASLLARYDRVMAGEFITDEVHHTFVQARRRCLKQYENTGLLHFWQDSMSLLTKARDWMADRTVADARKIEWLNTICTDAQTDCKTFMASKSQRG